MTDSILAHNTAQGGDGGQGANGGDGLGGGLGIQVGSSATVSNGTIKHNEADGGNLALGASADSVWAAASTTSGLLLSMC